MDYNHLNRGKFLLTYHMIFVTKYRRRCLQELDIVQTMIDVSQVSNFDILEQEFEPDHIHMMIRSVPKHSVLSIVRRIKSMSTIRVWKKFPTKLKKFYWKENTL
jgi:putative transposase